MIIYKQLLEERKSYMNLQKLYSYTRQAIEAYELIDEGDKIAIGISGGKDSLALLYALSGIQKFYPKKFDIVAITVDLGFDNFNLDNIIKLCKLIKVEYHIIKTEIGNIVFEARKEKNPCSLCAKMRKGALNQAVKELGCNKIAYAHHKDDILHTLFLSYFFESQLYSFAPYTFLEKSQLAIIRPFVFIPEKEIIGFQKKYNLPVVKNPCPADGDTKREEMKELIELINKKYPGVKKRMFSAISNSMIPDWEFSRLSSMDRKRKLGIDIE